jgi:hypothetical protein
MPQHYKIAWVGDTPREYDAHGPKKAWRIALEDVEGTGELRQNQQTPPPNVGDLLYGEMTPMKSGTGYVFRKSQDASPQGSQPRPMNAAESMPEPVVYDYTGQDIGPKADPVQKLIVRQAAQRSAATLLSGLVAVKDNADLPALLRYYRDFFETDAWAVLGVAKQEPQGEPENGIIPEERAFMLFTRATDAMNPHLLKLALGAMGLENNSLETGFKSMTNEQADQFEREYLPNNDDDVPF